MFLAQILAIRVGFRGFRVDASALTASCIVQYSIVLNPTLCWCNRWPVYVVFLADEDLWVSPMRFPHVGAVQMLLKMPQNRVWGRPNEKNGHFLAVFLGVSRLGGQFWVSKLHLIDFAIESAIVRHALRNILGFGLERIGPPRQEVQCKT